MPEIRMPPLPPETYTADQRVAADEFLALRKMPVFGPFDVLIRSPELMTRAMQMGDYLRFRASIGRKLTEFTILIMAREWSQDFEWYVHHPLALKAGVRPEIAGAIRDGRRPEGMAEDEDIVYSLAIELLRRKSVSDATYARACKQFGENGVVDIVGLCGFYTMIAMTLTTARVPLPADGTPLPRFPE